MRLICGVLIAAILGFVALETAMFGTIEGRGVYACWRCGKPLIECKCKGPQN